MACTMILSQPTSKLTHLYKIGINSCRKVLTRVEKRIFRTLILWKNKEILEQYSCFCIVLIPFNAVLFVYKIEPN